MSEPFIAEIKIVGFNFPPRGWAQCDGQILPINQNQSLYALLGTTYGGDGRTTFALPDLRGRVPIHFDSGHFQGQKSGAETHTLTAAEMPSHTHAVDIKNAPGNSNSPLNNYLAQVAWPIVQPYSDQAQAGTQLHAGTIANTGGQAHENMQPYLTLNFCIALQGLFPSRS
jgi:microcystin-dependent protein